MTKRTYKPQSRPSTACIVVGIVCILFFVAAVVCEIVKGPTYRYWGGDMHYRFDTTETAK